MTGFEAISTVHSVVINDRDGSDTTGPDWWSPRKDKGAVQARGSIVGTLTAFSPRGES